MTTTIIFVSLLVTRAAGWSDPNERINKQVRTTFKNKPTCCAAQIPLFLRTVEHLKGIPAVPEPLAVLLIPPPPPPSPPPPPPSSSALLRAPPPDPPIPLSLAQLGPQTQKCRCLHYSIPPLSRDHDAFPAKGSCSNGRALVLFDAAEAATTGGGVQPTKERVGDTTSLVFFVFVVVDDDVVIVTRSVDERN